MRNGLDLQKPQTSEAASLFTELLPTQNGKLGCCSGFRMLLKCILNRCAQTVLRRSARWPWSCIPMQYVPTSQHRTSVLSPGLGLAWAVGTHSPVSRSSGAATRTVEKDHAGHNPLRYSFIIHNPQPWGCQSYPSAVHNCTYLFTECLGSDHCLACSGFLDLSHRFLIVNH